MEISKTEKHRLFCELRHWIRLGYRNKDKYAELEKRISKKRGIKSAKLLIKRIEWYLNATTNSSSRE